MRFVWIVVLAFGCRIYVRPAAPAPVAAPVVIVVVNPPPAPLPVRLMPTCNSFDGGGIYCDLDVQRALLGR